MAKPPKHPTTSPSNPERRDFLRASAGTFGAAAAASALPLSIERALAIPAHRLTGSIADIEHVVIFMQENRAFDHYYGTLRGVRGFGDRHTIPVNSGTGQRPVWYQTDERGHATLPFHLDTKTTGAQCVADLDHSWTGTHMAWNQGRWNQWVPAKSSLTMGYYKRADLPFYYALADAFTICDAYFCSAQSSTNPNRIYLWTGTLDPAGIAGGPAIDNSETGYSWTTYPERLQAAGVSWRVYQNPSDNSFVGNYDDNALAWFTQYRNAPADSPLAINGMSKWTLDDLANDVLSNRLPQVSWIVAPEAFSEHPSWPPAYGADYTARLLDILTANPEVWSKTALLLMYDENDGFFDHVVAPTAPASSEQGISTIDTSGEFYTGDGQPFGLGPRVPLLVISPWSRGGYVCSEVFDHTSVIRFLEQRFGVEEPNISPWRRAVCGDLTSAFDFTHSNATVPKLPNTKAEIASVATSCIALPAHAPLEPSMANQETGTRPSRPLPYALSAAGKDSDDGMGFVLTLYNTAAAAIALNLYDRLSDNAPRFYTIGAGHQLEVVAPSDPISGRFDFSLHGPNGFERRFHGHIGASDEPLLVLSENGADGSITLEVKNRGSQPITLRVRDRSYGMPTRVVHLSPGSNHSERFALQTSGHWYDLEVRVDQAAQFCQIYAGRVETGQIGISDPALGQSWPTESAREA